MQGKEAPARQPPPRARHRRSRPLRCMRHPLRLARRSDRVRRSCRPKCARVDSSESARRAMKRSLSTPTPDPRRRRLVDESGCLEVPEQVAAEEALGKRRLSRSDRQVDLAGRGELLGDLKARVAATDEEDDSLGDVPRRPVGGAVKLDGIRVEALGDRGHERHLERARGHDHLVGFVGAVVELEQVPALGPAYRADAAVELDRQLEATGVLGQIGRHLVPCRIRVRVARERQPRKAAVAHRVNSLSESQRARHAAAGSAAASTIVKSRPCCARK
jgi:hypothetical protein